MIGSFEEIPGQEAIKAHLLRVLVQKRQPHLALYAGPEGSAVLPLAGVVAKSILCKDQEEGIVCGNCASCRSFDRGTHPDLHFFFPMAGGATTEAQKELLRSKYQKAWRAFISEHPYGGVVRWRYLLQQQDGLQSVAEKDLSISRNEVRRMLEIISLTPYMGQYNVVLIWLPELLHHQAAPALLKTFEEPHSRTLFILVTHHPWRLLLTLRSRAQLFRVPPFRQDEIREFLKKKAACSDEEALLLAARSGGDLDYAIECAKRSEPIEMSLLKDWMRACWLGTPDRLIEISETFAAQRRLWQQTFLRECLYVFRQILLQKEECLSIAPPSVDLREFIVNLSKNIPYEILCNCAESSNRMILQLAQHAHPKMLFLVHSLRITRSFEEQRAKNL